MGLVKSNTYKMANLGRENCNGMIRNRQIVITYLRTPEIVMLSIKKHVDQDLNYRAFDVLTRAPI